MSQSDILDWSKAILDLINKFVCEIGTLDFHCTFILILNNVSLICAHVIAYLDVLKAMVIDKYTKIHFRCL